MLSVIPEQFESIERKHFPIHVIVEGVNLSQQTNRLYNKQLFNQH